MKSISEILTVSLWYNKNFRIGHKSFIWKNWKENGISYIYQLINSDGSFKTINDIQNEFGIQIKGFQYLQLIYCIPLQCKKIIKKG